MLNKGNQCSKLRVRPAPGVHVLATGCMILRYVHPVGAPFFETLDIAITTCARVYRAGCMIFLGNAPCDVELLGASQTIAEHLWYLLKNRSSVASQLLTMQCFHILLRCSSL